MTTLQAEDRTCDEAVLVVEDDDDLRSILCELIQDAGFRTCAASDGSEAMTMLERVGERPCVILLDLMMPGVNGWSFRRWQLDSTHADVPVVILSAVPNLAKEASALDAAGYLAKPVSFETVLQWVERYCGCS